MLTWMELAATTWGCKELRATFGWSSRKNRCLADNSNGGTWQGWQYLQPEPPPTHAYMKTTDELAEMRQCGCYIVW